MSFVCYNEDMSDYTGVKIISFVGLAGAGKTTATEYMTAKHIPKVSFGDIIRQSMQRAAIDPSETNERSFITHLLAQGHAQFIEQHTLPHFRSLIEAGQRRIVTDGSSSLEEYRALMASFPGSVTTVALVSPKHLRYQRVEKRADHPLTRTEAIARDIAEAEYEDKAAPIALADHYLINDSTKDALYDKLDKLCVELNFVK